jgi:nitroreductase
VAERAAGQAPTGSNLQGWRFVVVSDPEPKARLAELYARAFKVYASQKPPDLPAGDLRAASRAAVVDSAVFLAQNLHRVPLMVIPCVEGQVEGQPSWLQAAVWGSIIPATWSLMLALRSRGLGSAYTTLHLMHEKQAAELLGIPAGFVQAALLPVAWYLGEGFKPAKRLPAAQLTYWNRWGSPPP